jgi:MoaA/NifB/PqqE/SkfB family radical SAM enzyme
MSKRKFRDYNRTRDSKSLGALCHAPAGSILFTPSGHAQVCHYNRGYNYGKYPDQSVKEIFESAARKQLKNNLRKYKLTPSCFVCDEAIKSNNYHNVGAKKYDNLADTKKFPSLVELQLSNICNLQCPMCSGEYSSAIREKRENKPAIANPFDKDFIEQFVPYLNRIERINFTGGEPILIPLYYKFWEKIIELNPEIEINLSTNASVLSDKFRKLMPKGKFSFTVSIDSIVPHTYSLIRKNAQLNTTLENINLLKEYCTQKGTSFSVKACILTINYKEIPEFLDYWNKLGVNVFLKPVWFPPYLSLQNLSKSEIEEIVNEYKRYKPNGNNLENINNLKMWDDTISQLEIWAKSGINYNTEKFNINDLEDVFIENIYKAYKKRGLKSNIIDSNIEKLGLLLREIKKQLGSEDIYFEALKYYNFVMPFDVFINELEHGNPEAFVGRLSQAGERNCNL